MIATWEQPATVASWLPKHMHAPRPPSLLSWSSSMYSPHGVVGMCHPRTIYYNPSFLYWVCLLQSDKIVDIFCIILSFKHFVSSHMCGWRKYFLSVVINPIVSPEVMWPPKQGGPTTWGDNLVLHCVVGESELLSDCRTGPQSLGCRSLSKTLC